MLLLVLVQESIEEGASVVNPWGQGMHSVEPYMAASDPAEQYSQLDDPLSALNEPGRHIMQVEPPSPEE